MPELPEVETIKNELSPYVIGQAVSGVSLFWEGIVRQSSLEEFCARLIGQKITGVGRRGKYLIFSLSSGQALVIHLKMTGSLWLKDPEKFVRAIIHLDDGSNIYFRDPRKFGIMWLVDDKESVGGKLGPEALGEGFSARVLAERLSERTAPIKALLCDQSLVAGIGNMYADEALFLAKIHPMRAGGSLTEKRSGASTRLFSRCCAPASTTREPAPTPISAPAARKAPPIPSSGWRIGGGSPAPSAARP